ncbi:hypothetical protein EVAR_50354_1 [Eumeta japonica]|uniref:Uncharacterized protein n=1 Tax=Eumeta variegata TaxID=151549 RepID=A0A4C1Y0Y3_EUMVA|nr:hypothetical protein EVAR_50354_1 [Eumeta japonica]
MGISHLFSVFLAFPFNDRCRIEIARELPCQGDVTHAPRGLDPAAPRSKYTVRNCLAINRLLPLQFLFLSPLLILLQTDRFEKIKAFVLAFAGIYPYYYVQ